ncbi:hypothetical protein N431DRAFT_423550 [Stipitochalara longipes BDJ]|nr:hypothetical protein N431DRAFT_423550 [Stipitochalara longipes BDJ]
MSGVTRFVNRPEQRAPTSPGSSKRLDPAAAQSLKFGLKPKNFEAPPAPPAQYLPSTAFIPGYASNYSASRNTHPSNPFAKQQPPPYRKTFDVATVDSDFDETKTDLDYDLEDGNDEYRQEEGLDAGRLYGAQAEQRNSRGFRQHTLHHVRAQAPLIVNPESDHVQSPSKPHTSGTHSRFKSHRATHSDLQLRPGQAADVIDQQTASSKKRHRSDEPPRNNYEQQRRPDNEALEEIDEYEISGPNSKERQNHFEASSDEVETPAASPTRQRKARVAQSSQPTMGDGFPAPDYTDEKLKGMKYSDLKAEDWDTIPNPKPFDLPAKLRGRHLGDQIAYYADRSKKNDDADDMVLFFEQLSTSEWEQAGDIIIEKFADLLKQVKEKRQEKRRITEQFEAEIEAREKAVRGKSDLFEKKLKEMEVSGKGVLRGNMI